MTTTTRTPLFDFAYAQTDLPSHCRPVDFFLYNFSWTFSTCVPTYLGFVSTVLGTCSILAWLFAQLPQIYKNYRMRSTAGLSAYFLLEWCLGDAANLSGCLLTNQAAWQVVVAAYYTFVDCVLVGQYVWYDLLGKGRKAGVLIARRKSNGQDGEDEARPLLEDETWTQNNGGADAKTKPTRQPSSTSRDSSFGTFNFPTFGSPSREKDSNRPSSGQPIVRSVTTMSSPNQSPRNIILIACFCAVLGHASPIMPPTPLSASLLISKSAYADPTQLAGCLISWLSTALYLVSRLPQLIKNYRRRSTAGLSSTLFAAAFCGNLFYSTSLLTNPLAWNDYGSYGGHGWAGPEGSARREWVLSAIPFFLGAAGVLGLDAAVGVQFLLYGDGRRGTYASRAPIVVETTPTAEGSISITAGTSAGAGVAAGVPRTRILAVPRGGIHDTRLQAFESGSWRRVSGYMRGWVPSLGIYDQGGYMAAAASVGRAARDRMSGFVSPRERSRIRVRQEAEVWEARIGTVDDERPLLEREDLGEGGPYGSL